MTDFIVCDVLFSLDVWVLEEPLASDADVFSVSEVLCELFEAKILSGTGFCLSDLVHEQRPKTKISANNAAMIRFVICVIPHKIMFLGKKYHKHGITLDLKCR